MAIDFTGMFTGNRPDPSVVSNQPPSGLGPSAQASMQVIQQGEQRAKQGLSGMFGTDFRSPAEQVKEQLTQLNRNKLEDQPKIVELLRRVDPQASFAAEEIFKQQNLKTTTDKKRRDSLITQADALGLDSTAAGLRSGGPMDTAATQIRQREEASIKLKNTVYKPEFKTDTDGNITVISTDPKTAGDVISRNTTKSAAAIVAEDVVKAQEKENRIQSLTISAGTLSGQVAQARLSLKEAEEEASILPLATNLQAQKDYPLWGSMVSGNTYKKLENSLRPIKSQQALNTIAEMKAQSSTGATGLGATNAMEFIALESNIRSLDALVPSSIEAGIQEIERNLENILLVNQGRQPKINWDLPVYAHMVQTASDGSRTYSYDGKSFYKIIEEPTE